MAAKSKQMEISISDLLLDPNNPRFAELYSGSKDEEDLIEYLLYNESADELAKNISVKNEFYQDEMLWVIKKGTKYIVKDGNRRCAAVKALQLPGLYKLPYAKTAIKSLPVLLYRNEQDLQDRIMEQHTGDLFKKWDRIAQALEALKLHEAKLTSELNELDPRPGDLIKLASFYREAVKIAGDDLKALLRRGRGNTGGKAIIFERLFRDAKECGYAFRNSPNFLIEVRDKGKFSNYVNALVKYIKAHPLKLTAKYLDDHKRFIDELKDYGFDPKAKPPFPKPGNPDPAPNPNPTPAPDPSPHPGPKPGKTKKYPNLYRSVMPPGIKTRVMEYFSMNSREYPNAKIAMARVTFECVMKFVVDNTKFNGKTVMSKSPYFQRTCKPSGTDFTGLKRDFTELINVLADKNAFKNFDLLHQHNIVHNYKSNAVHTAGDEISHNLMELIEFLLNEETELLSKLKLNLL